MLKDRVNFIKSNEAYVAYVNSHIENNKILESLNILNLAQSFFMYKIPYIKELKGIQDQNQVIDQEYMESAQKAEFKDNNQKV